MKRESTMTTLVAATALIAFPKCVSGGIPAAETPDRVEETPATHTGPEVAERPPAPKCPMRLSSVEVQAVPTEEGATLTFTTLSGGPTNELRERGWSVAAVYDVVNPRGEDEPTPEAWPPPPAPTRVDVTEIADGIALDISALHSKDTEEIRDHIQELARVMEESGDCPNVLPRA